VVISVANPEEILLPGMTAYVNIAVAERKDVLQVPNAALRFKPANADMQKSAVIQKNDAQKSGGSLPSDTQGGAKPKRDAFSGKVYVLEKGALKPISVTLGITDNRNTEIAGGELKAGDQLVIGEVQAADKPTSSSSKPPMRMF
jgi:HlyD family secretion protein